jgi:hypothetical protein
MSDKESVIYAHKVVTMDQVKDFLYNLAEIDEGSSLEEINAVGWQLQQALIDFTYFAGLIEWQKMGVKFEIPEDAELKGF